MAELSITECSVLSRVGDNRVPSIGNASFSDGKHYTWLSDTFGTEIEFKGLRGNPGFRESFHFKSPKRAALVKEWLNENA